MYCISVYKDLHKASAMNISHRSECKLRRGYYVWISLDILVPVLTGSSAMTIPTFAVFTVSKCSDSFAFHKKKLLHLFFADHQASLHSEWLLRAAGLFCMSSMACGNHRGSSNKTLASLSGGALNYRAGIWERKNESGHKHSLSTVERSMATQSFKTAQNEQRNHFHSRGNKHRGRATRKAPMSLYANRNGGLWVGADIIVSDTEPGI